MRGDVLVVVIGVLCRHPGSRVFWNDNSPSGSRARGERERQGVHFLIQRDQAFTHVMDN